MKTLALTGATGSIGTALTQAFVQAGWHVRTGARRAIDGGPGTSWFRFEIGQGFDAAALRGCAAAIHLAWDAQADAEAARSANVAAAQAFLMAARAAQVGLFVFISSMSAHDRAQSAYGRSKREVEQLLDPARDLAIRPGFVLARGGVCGRLSASLRRLPVVPLFDGGRQPLQTVALDDLVRGVVAAVERGRTGLLVLAHPRVLSVRAFYQALLDAQGRSGKPMCPLPSGPALIALRLIERLRLSLPMTSENLLGLRALQSHDVRADLALVGLEPLDCVQALARLYDAR